MSVVKSDTVGWLLDHQAYVNQSYRCCHHMPPDTRCCRYIFKAAYFDIEKPHIADTETTGDQETVCGDSRTKGRKRKRKRHALNQGEVEAQEYHKQVCLAIRSGTRKLIEQSTELGKQGIVSKVPAGRECIKKQISLVVADSMLVELCSMAKQMAQEQHQPVQVISDEADSTADLNLLGRLTENSTDCARIVMLMGQRYLLPPHSSFLLSDISCMEPLLGYKKYDVITLDPPWENKSVKRSKGYSHLFPWQIQQIPVPELSAPGCLVVSWVTNRQRHLRFVKEQLYPSWSVEVVAEWHWVKVTRHGDFVVPLDSTHKKPYEILVLGRYKGSSGRQNGENATETAIVPDHKLLVSVPCLLHSHKPPLGEVLKGLTRPNPDCLELFARNLQHGWTSWGNEVLRFQHLDYFQEFDIGGGDNDCCILRYQSSAPVIPPSC
ncbi:N(6)-adenine-specific methyltransferase METTL4 [Chiloscyllium punctatum]|uniref:Methyltransferase-like protein 4 n=1 Tax=Chiloscyllium punctatum TaxID=137246 RepID=A0A401SB33_CHIPU|nr:hypothetical protein [Chiloscyllium punctatum]